MSNQISRHSFKGRGLHSRRQILLGTAALMVTAASLADGATRDGPAPDWSPADMPAQRGRIFLVTGGTSGIGFETAKALAAAGAQVVIASRDAAERGAEVLASIYLDTPGAQLRYERFDLSDLATVRALGARLRATLPRLDGLINNAGIMEPPERGISASGLEMQFAVNYLGHFALTAELLPLLRRSNAPRVVTLSSIAAARGSIHFSDLQFEKDYDALEAYRQSKLACLMFALELQRRSDAAGWGLRSMASHPGVARTNLQTNTGALRRSLRVLFQTAAQGAVPTLYAATAPDAQGGSYYGPTGFMQARGELGLARVPAAATDAAAAARLWAVSETLSGARFTP
jgi:NAD(P)-dependent dehydrogenase (short-subunit alcohol dehydrogenase family)